MWNGSVGRLDEGCLQVRTLPSSMLTKVKDPVIMEKQAKVLYRIPCSCGKESFHVIVGPCGDFMCGCG